MNTTEQLTRLESYIATAVDEESKELKNELTFSEADLVLIKRKWRALEAATKYHINKHPMIDVSATIGAPENRRKVDIVKAQLQDFSSDVLSSQYHQYWPTGLGMIGTSVSIDEIILLRLQILQTTVRTHEMLNPTAEVDPVLRELYQFVLKGTTRLRLDHAGICLTGDMEQPLIKLCRAVATICIDPNNPRTVEKATAEVVTELVEFEKFAEGLSDSPPQMVQFKTNLATFAADLRAKHLAPK